MPTLRWRDYANPRPAVTLLAIDLARAFEPGPHSAAGRTKNDHGIFFRLCARNLHAGRADRHSGHRQACHVLRLFMQQIFNSERGNVALQDVLADLSRVAGPQVAGIPSFALKTFNSVDSATVTYSRSP